MKSPADLTDADAALPHEATLASLRAVSALAGVYAAILAQNAAYAQRVLFCLKGFSRAPTAPIHGPEPRGFP